MLSNFKKLVDGSQKIIVVQASNPDGDSLASALALEEILTDLGKDVSLYCGMEIPQYLKFLSGWSRVSDQFDDRYDLAIMVDNSSLDLIDKHDNRLMTNLRNRPLAIIDHHKTPSSIDFVDCQIIQPEAIATGQIIYEVASELAWPLNQSASEYITSSILSDSLGFNSPSMLGNSKPLRIVADLVDKGVDLAKLYQERLKWQQITPKILHYKGQLIQRIEFLDNNQIACLTINHSEIKEFSYAYNPTIVLDEMRFVEGVKLALGFKQYLEVDNTISRITVRIRCYDNYNIAQELAEKFGGGGHPGAAGIKQEGNDLDFENFKNQITGYAGQLLANSRKT